MRNRVGLILVLALLSGGLAAYLAFTFLREPSSGQAQAAETDFVGVTVAARDMDVGEVVASEDVRLVEWPANAVPAGYSTDPAEVVGRGLLATVRANEPLLSTKLALREGGGGMPITIPDGMRAVSVKVDEVIGVAGFAVQNTRVDVLVTLDQTEQNPTPATQVVLQNIEILAAGQSYERDNEGQPQTVPVVTLLVTPEQSEKLTLAATKGRIQLALRNRLDLDTVATPGIRVNQLLVNRQPAPAPRRAAAPRRPSGVTVEVYRGPQMETSTVEDNGGGS